MTTGSLAEILLESHVTRDNYRDLLAGDGREVYSRTPTLSYGRVVRAVWIRRDKHEQMLDRSLHNVGQGLKRELEELADATASFQQAGQTLIQNPDQEEARAAYLAWGEALAQRRTSIEWLQSQGTDLDERWHDLRDILSNLEGRDVSGPLVPIWGKVAAAALGLAGGGTLLLLAYRRSLRRIWAIPAGVAVGITPPLLCLTPSSDEEGFVPPVHLPEKGLQDLFNTLPLAEGYGRFDRVRRLTGLFPPIGALAQLRHDNVPDAITSWIGAINRACEREDEPLTPRLLHHTLLDLSIQFAQDLERPSDRCGYIEWILEENGCTVFQQEDPGHRAWVESLEEGSELREGDRVGTLGQDLGSHMFRIEGTHNVVRFDPLNEARLGIRRAEQTYHAQSSVLTFSSVGPLIGGGRAARCEVLSDWATRRRWKDDATDQNFIKSFAAQMRLIVEAGRRPAGYLRDLVRTNDAGHVRWETSGDEMVDVDVLELEDFFRECSKGKETIFHQWMDKTRMSECPKAMQLRGDLMTALRGNREGLSQQVLDMVPRYDAIIKRAACKMTVDYDVPVADMADDLAGLKAELLNQLQATLVAANVILEPPGDLKRRLIQSVIVLTGRQYPPK